jgi:YD repeat-containing protein
MRTRVGLLAGVTLVALLVIGALSVASGSSRSHLRTWGLQPGVAPHKAVVPHAAGTTQVVVFTRNEHAVDVDEPPTGFSQGDESTTSAGEWNAAGQRVGHLDAAGTVTAVFQKSARLQFTFTSTLQGGTITATGVLIGSQSTQGFDAAITGGTGKYRGAEGEVHVQFLGPHSTRATYELVS